MNQSFAYFLVFFVAAVFANLPFLSQRMFGSIRVVHKGGWLLVFEVALGYCLTGLIGILFEGQLGGVHRQSWEFYALTLCLFLVLGFPGFVYRFLWRRPEPT